MGIVERYKLWSAIRKVQPITELGDTAGGRDAELALRERIGTSFRFQGAEVFAGRRVPSRLQNRRREIDLIVCSPRQIHLIEIKNWSGKLETKGRDWLQTRRAGDVVNHHDLLAENLLKRDAIVEYLSGAGLPIDDDFAATYLAPSIMFMNPNLEIETRIEALPEVFSRRELDQYLGKQPQKSLSDRLFASLIQYCFSKNGRTSAERPAKPIDPKLYPTIVDALSKVATWDQISFLGSRTITGDIISLKLGHRILRRAEMVEESQGHPIVLKWTRNSIVGWLNVLTGLGSLGSLWIGRVAYKLSLDDMLLFQDVGQRESTNRHLVDIDRILMG